MARSRLISLAMQSLSEHATTIVVTSNILNGNKHGHPRLLWFHFHEALLK